MGFGGVWWGLVGVCVSVRFEVCDARLWLFGTRGGFGVWLVGSFVVGGGGRRDGWMNFRRNCEGGGCVGGFGNGGSLPRERPCGELGFGICISQFGRDPIATGVVVEIHGGLRLWGCE